VLPRTNIELRVHGLNLPSSRRAVKVASNESVDTFSRELLGAHSRSPAERNLRAGVDDVVNREADWELGALAGDEGGLAAECVASQWDAGQPVDAVAGVGEVGCEEGVGCGVGVGAEERAVAVGQVGGCRVGEAESSCGS
jgi:hypothetical protein